MQKNYQKIINLILVSVNKKTHQQRKEIKHKGYIIVGDARYRTSVIIYINSGCKGFEKTASGFGWDELKGRFIQFS